MNKITQSSIETLLQYDGEEVLTVYVPTHRFSTPPNISEDQTRFKNLIEQGFAKWQEHEIDFSKTMHQELLKLIEDLDFWHTTTEGLALFISKDSYEIYHLPIECPERIYVGSTYEITPLLLLKEIDNPFYVFALAEHGSKLFKGDLYNLEPVEIDFPQSPEDALNIDEMFSGSNTIRGVSTQGSGNGMLSSHGQGDSNHAGQEEHLKYLRILDHLIINSDSVDNSFPIIVAGTDSEVSDFRGVSKLRSLVETHISGNHTATSTQDLHALAKQVVQKSILYPKMHEEITRFNEQQGLEKASTDVAAILEATSTGRVDCLIVGMFDMTTDSVSDIAGQVLRIRYPHNQDADTVLSLVRLVVKQGGYIVGVDRSLLPDNILVAANYRY